MPQCEVTIRICTACGEPLESRDFYRLTKDKSRLTSECKKCKKLRRNLYYEKHKKEISKKYSNTYPKEHVIGENPIDRVNKILESIGICWLDNLRVWHKNKFGGKKDGSK